MMSLFSSFDSGFFLFWTFLFFFFLQFFLNYFYKISFFMLFYDSIFSSGEKFFQSNKKKFFSKFTQNLILSVFLLIFLINIFSLMPFSFTLTAQVSVVMFMSLILWSEIFVFYFINNFKGFFSHCIPEGCPLGLSIFLFLIEIVSSLIRPITLTVRLTANIVAGHVIMHLLHSLVTTVTPLFFFYFLMNIVEIFVCFIQAWIFSTLISLYYAEMN